MSIPIIPLIVFVLGIIGYHASKNPKTIEVCRIAYFCGLFVLLLSLVKLLTIP